VVVLRCAERARSCRLGLLERGSRAERPAAAGFRKLFGYRGQPSGGVIAQEILAITIALFLVNLWEETAWAGFLQSRLERRHNFFIAAALTAIPFAAVHLPLRIINGAKTPETVGIAFLTLLAFSFIFRALIGMVLRGAANSILLAAATHTFFNRSNNIDGIAADLLEGSNRPVAALLAATLTTVVLGICLRRKLRRRYRDALDEAEDPAPAATRQPVAASADVTHTNALAISGRTRSGRGENKGFPNWMDGP
jgi:membrane protease YdiL (CAAX protease family)